MMGQKARLFTPVCALSLDELVPADHFYRRLDRVLELSFVCDLVQDRYMTGVGRPSVDPRIFFKLQLVMLFEGIRSDRQLMRLAADRLSVRWYLGYNLDEPLPNRSSLTRIRTRYGVATFRRFFDAIVEQCQEAGLVWGRELYFDATQVPANAARDSLTPRFAVEAREAIRAHLDALFPGGEVQEPPELAADASEHMRSEVKPEKGIEGMPLPAHPLPTPLPFTLQEPLHGELAATTAVRHDWIAEVGRQQREVRGLYRRTADFCISATDADGTRYASSAAARIWATKPITWLTAANDGSSYGCW